VAWRIAKPRERFAPVQSITCSGSDEDISILRASFYKKYESE